MKLLSQYEIAPIVGHWGMVSNLWATDIAALNPTCMHAAGFLRSWVTPP